MNSQFYDTLAKVLSGEATPAEQAELDALMRTDKEAAEAYKSATAIWKGSEAALPRFSCNVSTAWSKVASRTGCFTQEKPVRKTIAFPAWGRWAAAASVLLAGVLIVRTLGNGQETMTASSGSRVIALADGSRVTLHQGATLRYPRSFGDRKERHVELDGRAFFEVTRNPAQPFVVEGDAVNVTVLGTSFEVDDQQSRVAVRTGKVQVAEQAHPERKVIILPGEQTMLKSGGLEKETADPNDLYWKTGELTFNNRPLEAVIKEISRILGVPVQLDASIPVSERSQAINFTSSSKSVDLILNDLCRITGYRWERGGDAYRILRAR
jgi:ferric-dicitrate binding protein FerR (iron transport regulator)